MISVHNSYFRQDPKFRAACRLGKATGPWGRQDVEWRAYVCCWAAWSERDKGGDFVEYGLNRGALSRAVMHYVDFNQLDNTFWLLGTFDGLVDELIAPDERRSGILPAATSLAMTASSGPYATFRRFAS